MFVGAQFLVLGMLDIFLAVLAIDVLDVGQEGAGVLAAGVGSAGSWVGPQPRCSWVGTA